MKSKCKLIKSIRSRWVAFKIYMLSRAIDRAERKYSKALREKDKFDGD